MADRQYLIVTTEQFEQQASMIERTGRTLRFQLDDQKDKTESLELAYS